MLLKVAYFLLGYMLVDGFFLKTHAKKDKVEITFNIKKRDEPCSIAVRGENVLKNKNSQILELSVHEGVRTNLVFKSTHFMNYITCFVNDTTNSFVNHEKKQVYTAINDRHTYIIESIDNANYTGRWDCQILTRYEDNNDADLKYLVVIKDNKKYIKNDCYLDMNIVPKPDSSFPNLYIYISVGVIVAIIIIAQTAIILYLKFKAKKNLTRLDSLTLRARESDNTDTRRYSKPPGVKTSKFSRMLRRSTNQNDESIYETLEELRNGELTPPVPPIETIPTLKKKQSQTKEVMSQSLPRFNKSRAIPLTATPSTLHRIPEKKPAYEPDISKRPPLPLPKDLAEEDEENDTTNRLKRPQIPPLEEAGTTSSTFPRPRPGIKQTSVNSELNNIFKTRNDSLATSPAKQPIAPIKNQSFAPLRRNMNKVPSGMDESSEHQFVSEMPNPLPSAKSATLLGLTPGIPPKPAPKTNPIKTPPKPNPPNPFSLPSKPVLPHLKPVPLKPVTNTPTAISVLPKPAPFSKVPTSKPIATVLPKQVVASTKRLEKLVKTPGPHNLRPVKPTAQTVQFQEPVTQLPTPLKAKPPYLPPANRTTPESVHEESEESFYNDEEWSGPESLDAKLEKPEKHSMNKPPPLPPPNRLTQEDIYEETADEPVYNSDEEWTYEPLQKYNIYSC